MDQPFRIEALVRRAGLIVAVMAEIWGPAVALGADPLPAFNVDLAQSSVSGLSSGAFMAVQFHVAFSQSLIGAGVVAGGPYDCAEGELTIALDRCMQTTMGRPDPAHLLERANAFAAEGRIDPLSGLANDRVYVFSGTEDRTVRPAVVDQVGAFYRLAGVPASNIDQVGELPAGHAFITESAVNACDVTSSPYINACAYDQAGDILSQIYGTLDPASVQPGGRLIEFDQSEFLPDPTVHGMATTGFAYVPRSCANGARCRVHIAFHGCKQTTALIGDAFLTETGYNRWADSNDLIILYPQAHETPVNPNGCWDWWGYDDPAYATRSGRQMAAVWAMLTRLAGGSEPQPAICEIYARSNFDHWWSGRAEPCSVWFLCAVGSGDYLGFATGFSTVYERRQGYFSTTPCTP
jgi:poly(3-hydroxybutyrate) depolymerase